MSAVGTGLQAALLLARGRSEGMSLLVAEGEASVDVAARSFWAAALCLPAFVCLRLIGYAHEPIPPAHSLALQLIGYVIQWTGFPLLSLWVVGTIGLRSRWPVLVAAWNWCSVVQYVLIVVCALPGLLGMPDIVGETAGLVVIGWMLWLEWYATWLALGVTAFQAVMLVLLAETFGYIVSAVTDTLAG